jgi:uncharacterized membrane protein
MNENIHYIASNYIYIVPFSILLTMAFLQWQKQVGKKNQIVDSTFIIRNALFVGLLVFVIVYLNKPLPSLEESLFVSPADF